MIFSAVFFGSRLEQLAMLASPPKPDICALMSASPKIKGRLEQDYPHIVELALPPGGFRARSDAMLAFHRERDIQIRRGRGRNEDGQFYVRYCFGDSAHAKEFCDQFGGERMTAKLHRQARSGYLDNLSAGWPGRFVRASSFVGLH